jgi:hypothetical protein
MADLTSEEHDAEAFKRCILATDSAARFLAQNEKVLTTLNGLGMLHEYDALVRDCERADEARVARVTAARKEGAS